MNKFQLQDKLFNFYCLYYVIKMSFWDKRSPKAIKKYQNKQLRKLIKQAYKIPLYKNKFDSVSIHPEDIKTVEDLAKIPPLTKAEYREWMNEELKTEEAKYYHKTHTSGSTGIPTTNIFPPKEYAQHYMMDFFCWMKGGYNPFFGKTLTRQAGDSSVGSKSFIQKIGILRREIFNTKWERSKIVEKINQYKPDFILANSSELIFIAQYIIENKIQLNKPHFYVPNGENIDGLSEQTLKSVFGEGLINAYGCSEMASFAVKKPDSFIYEIIENEIITMVKTEKEIISSGNGSLLVTPLYRSRYPLINYEIGDISILEYDKLGKKVITEIQGRKNDNFVWKNGKTTIYKNLENINMTLNDIFQIRFIQESDDSLKLQVVKDIKSSKTTEELEKYLLSAYSEEFKDINIYFEWLPVIPPDPNGKIRNMISMIQR